MIGIWFVVCGWAESFDDRLHPGQGASFFSLIPLVYGWLIFLVGFPLAYLASRGATGGAARGFRDRTALGWLLWLLPVLVFAGIAAVAAIYTGDPGETALISALGFPVLSWRGYASLMDLTGYGG